MLFFMKVGNPETWVLSEMTRSFLSAHLPKSICVFLTLSCRYFLAGKMAKDKRIDFYNIPLYMITYTIMTLNHTGKESH